MREKEKQGGKRRKEDMALIRMYMCFTRQKSSEQRKAVTQTAKACCEVSRCAL
jgi:hypothetical protein